MTNGNRGEIRHPLFARMYQRMCAAAEKRGGAPEHRARMLAGLAGRVVEIGAGDRLLFAHILSRARRS